MKYVFKNKFYIFLITIFDFVGKIFSSFFPKKKSIKNIDNILLVRLDHLGDVIHSLFIPQILKKYYPNAKITFLVSSGMREIVASNPFVDGVICFEAGWFNRDLKNKSSIKDIFKLIKELSSFKFDVGFDLRGDVRHILIMYLSKVKFKIGYGITGGKFLLELCPQYQKELSESDKNIRLVEQFLKNNLTIDKDFNIDGKISYDYLPFTPLEELNSKFDLGMPTPYILIHPFAGASSRMLPKEKWIDLISSLHNKYKNIGIIVAGRSNDTDFKLEGKNIINLVNKTTFKDLIGLCKVARLMISCNSGPAHIAYALNKPLLVIASGTNTIDNWFASSQNTRIIQKKTSCYDCQSEKCLKKRHECMENISVEEIMNEVNKLIS
jgi:ADP-heptose:LPS heptosyltransferase